MNEETDLEYGNYTDYLQREGLAAGCEKCHNVHMKEDMETCNLPGKGSCYLCPSCVISYEEHLADKYIDEREQAVDEAWSDEQ